MRLLLLIGTLLISSTASLGQISLAGAFMGNTGTIKFAVGVNAGKAAVYRFDSLSHQVDFAVLTLDSANHAAGTSIFGQAVSVNITATAASGQFGATIYNIARLPVTGPTAVAAYSGTVFIDGSMNVASVSIGPGGQVILLFIYSDQSGVRIDGGIGSINSANFISLPLVSGYTATAELNAVDGVAIGSVTVGSNSYPYVLAELRRPRLVNISTRGTVGGGNVLTAGFVSTAGSKTFLIRAVGPALAAYGVQTPNSDPRLTIFQGGVALKSNDNWGSDSRSSDVPAVAAQVGAFPLTNGTKDAAVLVTLEAGIYTVQVDSTAAAGDALVEVYEVL